MIDLQADISGWNRVAAQVADKLGIVGVSGSNGAEGRQFLKRQVALLTDTLIKVTPPKDRSKTRAAIERKVQKKFASVEENAGFKRHKYEGTGKSGVDWYFFTHKRMFGVAPEQDLRDANTDRLYEVFKQITKSGRLHVGHRGKQEAYIWQKTLTKEAGLKKLIARLKRHVGRLKAGWIPARDWAGGKPVAKWIEDHAANARGQVIPQLMVPGIPSVTLINRAAGAGHKDTKFFVHRALQIRAKAMAADMRLFIKGVKTRSQLLGG